MPQEIELKLAADPATLASLPQHPVLGPLLNGSPRRAKLLSRYYDTAAAELHEAGVALRLRRDGRQWLQTVKGPGSAVAGMHQRAEYEWKIAHPRLDFPKLATTPWHKTFVAVNGRLKSLFSTDILRISHPLAFADGTRATLCLDRGFIVAKGRRSPICELEIELIDGDAQRLRELGLQLTTDLPLAVAHRSKAERGYALAGAIPRQPVRARRVALPDHASAAAAVAAVGADCLEQIGANAEAVADGEDSEFVHQLRVGVRRLRSLLKFLATLIPPEEIAPLDEELSWISGATGVALGQLKARATRVRLAQRAAMREAAASPRLARLLLALGELFAKLASAPPSEAAASAHAVAENELGRRDKRLSKRVRGMRHASPTQRHRARIAAKKLRYASEFFAPLYSKSRAADYIDALAKLQGALGTLNDLATAGRLLGEIVPKDPSRTIAEAAGIVRGWIAASTVSELAHAAKARRAFAKLKPFWS